jgi:hypothetical protein
MELETLKIFGQVAGIGGLALGVFLFISRSIIKKSIFPTLTKRQSSRLLIILATMAWTIAIAGIIAWVSMSNAQSVEDFSNSADSPVLLTELNTSKTKIKNLQVKGRGPLNINSWNQCYEANYSMNFSEYIHAPNDFMPMRIELFEGNDGMFPPIIPKNLYPRKGEINKWNTLKNKIRDGSYMYWSKAPVYICFNESGEPDPRDGWGFEVILHLNNVTDKGEPFIFSNFFICTIIANKSIGLRSEVGQMAAGEGKFIKPTHPVILETSNPRYQKRIQLENIDYFTSSPGEFIAFKIPFKIKDLGKYNVNISFPFKYVGIHGSLSFDLPEFLAAKNMRYWDLMGEDAIYYTDFSWNGYNYKEYDK